MPSAAETLIARLQADCTAAEAAERSMRANVDAQIQAAERARAEAHQVPADSDANPPRAQDSPLADPPLMDPIAAFRAIEAWYEAERGEAFLQVYERYMPATPVVEF